MAALPNVFVVPPEEDQSPTWLCFQAPIPPPPMPQPPSALDGPGNDSEVVEVIKLGRPDPLPIKRSKTFRLRASIALRSLKNVAKHSKPKPPVQDVFSDDPTTPRPATPTLTRRSSIVLSQLFHPHAPSKPISEPPHNHTTPSSTHSSLTPTKNNDHPCDEAGRRPSSPSPSMRTCASNTRKRFSILGLHRLFSFHGSPTSPSQGQYHPSPYGDSSPDDDADAPLSTPSLSRDSSGPSTLSSSSGPDTPTEDQEELEPRSSDGTMHSEPLLRPKLPEEAPTLFVPGLGGSTWCLADSELMMMGTGNEGPVGHGESGGGELDLRLTMPQGPGDVSFETEMRLDSLHFDSLSFDPDDF